MPRLWAGSIQLGWRSWGEGDITVVFIHGNLASKDWIELAARHFPYGLRVIGIDWRGCGESDRPPAELGYTNYSIQQHALDMLAALDALKIPFCHLATHSTGSIIATRMLLMQPDRFGRIFALDPVTPRGIAFNTEQIDMFRSMMRSRDMTRTVMATAAPSLFVPESLMAGTIPRFRADRAETNTLFDRLIEQTCSAAEGIWIGTPFNLNLERKSSELERRMSEIDHPHLVVWGEKDAWISRADLEAMAAGMPDCRLIIVPDVGHSMNLELPSLYSGYFGAWFGGLRR